MNCYSLVYSTKGYRDKCRRWDKRCSEDEESGSHCLYTMEINNRSSTKERDIDRNGTEDSELMTMALTTDVLSQRIGVKCDVCRF